MADVVRHGSRADRLTALADLGVRAGFADYRRMFTWRSWAFGWMVRLLAQVAFFASVGQLLGVAGSRDYLALGNAALLGPMGALGVVASCAAERRNGTLVFVALSRYGPLPILAARGAFWVCDGVITAALATSLLPLVFAGVSPRALPAVFGLEVLATLSCYALALALAAVAIRAPEARTYLTTGTLMLIMLVGGVNLSPPDGPAGLLARILPLTHAIEAIRELAAGRTPPGHLIAGEALVFAGWLAVAAVSLSWSLRQVARNGSLA